MSVDGVTLVTTSGTSSMDRYGQALAGYVGLPTLRLDLHRAGGGAVRSACASPASLLGALEELRVARRLRAEPGLVHLTHHHLARYVTRRRTPYLVTVHDLIRWFDLTGGGAGWATPRGPTVLIAPPAARDRFGLRLDDRAFHRATAIIAVSEATCRDLVRHLAVPPERIHVVHQGLDHAVFRPVPERPVDGRYLLFVGSEHPRKNLSTLLHAFVELKKDRRFRDLRLVKVGSAGDAEAPFAAPARRLVGELGLDRAVVLTGHVPDRALPGYYTGAAAFVLPSLAEGFGLPPLEAMACGCPVIVSNAGALPEITGGTALTVPPTDVPALVAALRLVLTADGCAAELRARGLRRAAAFSWPRAARETLAVYDRVLGATEPGRGRCG